MSHYCPSTVTSHLLALLQQSLRLERSMRTHNYHRVWCGLVMAFLLGQLMQVTGAQNTAVEYIVYTTTLSWNEARTVCHSIGAELAKIDSPEVANAITKLDMETPEGELALDFWIGLVWSSPTTRHWMIDCSELNSEFEYNYPENHDQNKPCGFVDVSKGMEGKHQDCSHGRKFMCQRYTGSCYFDSNPCDTRVPGSVSDFDTCTGHCLADSTCETALYVAPSSCYKFTDGTGANKTTADATYGNKICMTLSLNATVVSPPTDTNPDPTLNCSVVNVGPEPEPSPTVSLAPSSSVVLSSYVSAIPTCSPVVLTEMITAHFTAHVTEHVTEMLTAHVTQLVSSPCVCTEPTAFLTATVASMLACPTPTYIPVSTVTEIATPTYIPVSTVTVIATPTYIPVTTVTEIATPTYIAVSTVTEIATPTYIAVSTVTIVATPTYIPVSTVIVAATPSCVLPSPSLIEVNLTTQEVVEIAEEIVKNLTVDVKQTSSYIRSLTCARDFRPSATAMGSVGIACVVAPLALLICLDLKRIADDLLSICKRNQTYTVKENKT